MSTTIGSLTNTVATIEAGIERGDQVGVQLAASLGGESVANLAIGLGGPEQPMTSDTMLPWFSMTKATTSLSALQQWERGRLGLDDPVVAHIPEFARGGPGKDKVTVRHLLTHTGGFRSADRSGRGSALSRSLAENVAICCDVPLEPGWVPGEKAGYHATAGMNLLAEIVQRLDGRPFERYVVDEVFGPLDMPSCRIGMTPEHAEAEIAAGRIGIMHRRDDTSRAFTPIVPPSPALALGIVQPGAGGRGPMRELVHLYEALVAGGARNGARIATAQTVEAMMARHRVGMFDNTFQATMDWGLGLHIDTAHMGRHCSPRAAGHGGAQSSIAFCDPVHGLAAAVVCNGMIGGGHAPRMEAILTALYVDLGLAAADAPGRDHAYPGRAA